MARPARTPTPQRWRGREPVYATLQPVVDGLARLLFRVRLEGLERIPREGPALVLPNHVSHLDPLVVFTALTRLGRRPRFVALADLWEKPVLGWVLDKGRMIPVHRGEGRRASEQMVIAACAAMQAGQIVVVYPEGQLPQPGQPQRPREGAGRLALATHAPVFPLAMSGVPRWTGGVPHLRRHVDVAIGAPLALDDLRSTAAHTENGPDYTTAIEASRRAMDAIQSLSAGPSQA
ncbi:MAG: lysophospholipid acyltransferase family protein [Nitriliruptorales bacterium]|nr:lysophospholipid acyltransferase family protein [Nitriliruptorales bacterium]